MKIYRSILINDDEEVDYGNLSISWTLCHTFAADHAEDINNCLEKDNIEIVEAEIDKSMIDFDNTLFSMENRPQEFEIVLKTNIDIVADNQKSNTGNGNEFDDYCDSYDGELTKNDLINLANEF